jgi:hypothetical protein
VPWRNSKGLDLENKFRPVHFLKKDQNTKKLLGTPAGPSSVVGAIMGSLAFWHMMWGGLAYWCTFPMSGLYYFISP